MKIAIDYDDTYTLDPEFWDGVIASANRCGHEILFVTMRPENKLINPPPEDHDGCFVDLTFKGCRVYYTNCAAKRKYMEFMGIYPDVWIDDNPKYVENDKRLRYDEVVESLEEAICGPDASAADGISDTIDGLYRLSGFGVLAAVVECIGNKKLVSEDVIAEIIRWMGRTNLPWGGNVEEIIKIGMEHESSIVRDAASCSLAEILGPKALPILKPLADKEPEEWLRIVLGKHMKSLEEELVESAYKRA